MDASGAVQPLNIPPSRARRTLAARLAQRNQDKSSNDDPDAADASALEVASDLPEEPWELSNMAQAQDPEGLQITGLRTVSGASHLSRGSRSKFSGLFSSSDDSDNDDDDDDDDDDDNDDSSLDEDEAGRDHTLTREGGEYEDESPSAPRRRRSIRRPNTTEAAVRRPLDDGDTSSSEDLEISDLPDDLPDSLERKLVLEAAAQGGPFADPPSGFGDGGIDDDDDSSEDELVEIRSVRRPS